MEDMPVIKVYTYITAWYVHQEIKCNVRTKIYRVNWRDIFN